LADNDFAGRTAVVTGASSGIGLRSRGSYPATDGQRLRVRKRIGRDDPGSERAEGVEGLAACPLAVGELRVACGDVA